jgi:hypothetical protein
MKITKISTGTYSFNDAIISSVYNKEDKTFLFTIERSGFYTVTSIQKNILVMSNNIESVYNSMNEISTDIDIDEDLTEAELALANFIRSYNPETDEVVSIREAEETRDEVLLALNKYLSTEADEDYSAFRNALEFEFSQDLAEELVIS